jgi:hypothetical protein
MAERRACNRVSGREFGECDLSKRVSPAPGFLNGFRAPSLAKAASGAAWFHNRIVFASLCG